MAVGLSKNYRVLRFLNKERSGFTRLLIGGCLALAVMIANFRTVQAKHVFRIIFQKKDSKSAFRKTAWFVKNSWIRKAISEDSFFDFTEGMSLLELDDIERFVERRSVSGFSDKCDRLFILAKKLDFATARGGFDEAFSVFKQRADEVLDTLDLTKTISNKKLPVSELREGDFDVSGATVALKDFSNLANQIGLNWFVISGTFLGLIRERAFLKHDLDIDLGFFPKDLDEVVFSSAVEDSSEFFLRKYEIQKSYSVVDGKVTIIDTPTIYKLIHRNGISIDLFHHYKEGTKTWHGSSIHIWENESFDLIPYEFYASTVFGPENSDLYLSENYGDWRTPKTEFSSSLDTPNLKIAKNYSSMALILKKIGKALEENEVSYLEYLSMLKEAGFLTSDNKVRPIV